MEEEAEDDELTPYDLFVDAALAEDLTTLAAMLREGHDINQANEAGETAFSYCCAYNKLAAAKYLYEKGPISTRWIRETGLPWTGRSAGVLLNSGAGCGVWAASAMKITPTGTGRRKGWINRSGKCREE